MSEEDSSFIPVAKPWLDEEDAEAVRRVILSGWVTQGPEVAAFEQEFADRVGATHACAVSSCTAALHLALRAVGVGPGGVGGRTTSLAVHVETHPAHIASLPVAVNLQCHSARHKEAVL